MGTIAIWSASGALEVSCGYWGRILVAALVGGWQAQGCNWWSGDYEVTGTTQRAMDYFPTAVGGTVDGADAAAMAAGLEKFCREGLHICVETMPDLSDAERQHVLAEVIPLLLQGDVTLL
jgi:hypothetical protein